MRIAVFTDTYLPAVDGVVTAIRNTRKTLQERGHKVVVVAPGARTQDAPEDGEVLYCRARALRRYPGYRLALLPSRREVSFLREHDIDLIHSHGVATMGIKGLWAARELGLPLVLTFHTLVHEAIPHYTTLRMDSGMPVRLLGRYLRSFIRRCDAVIVPTAGILEELREVAPEIRRSAVVPNGVDVETFHPDLPGDLIRARYGLEDAEVLLYVGRISPEKEVGFLLHALGPLLQEAVDRRLLVVGTGPALKTCQEQVRHLGLEDRVLFTGFVTEEELPLHYAAADALVTASRFETQGLSALEAMACGVPVAAVRYRAFPEYITDGVDGFLFPPEDPEACRGAAKRAIAAPPEVRRNARETAERFSLDACAEELLGLYRTLVRTG